jgi:hypothetical protein
MVFDPGALGTLKIGLEANSRREQTSSRMSARGPRRARRGAIRSSVAAGWRRVVAAFAPSASRERVRARDLGEGGASLG